VQLDSQYRKLSEGNIRTTFFTLLYLYLFVVLVNALSVVVMFWIRASKLKVREGRPARRRARVFFTITVQTFVTVSLSLRYIRSVFSFAPPLDFDFTSRLSCIVSTEKKNQVDTSHTACDHRRNQLSKRPWGFFHVG